VIFLKCNLMNLNIFTFGLLYYCHLGIQYFIILLLPNSPNAFLSKLHLKMFKKNFFSKTLLDCLHNIVLHIFNVP
jgi:hypothetical protein